MTATSPRSACSPGSPICQLLLRHLLSHSHALDSPSSKFSIVPSQALDLHKLLRAAEFSSACRLPIPALPSLHLRAGCQCLRCRIPRQPLFSSAYAPDEFSCLAWTFHRQANVRQQTALPIFLRRTYSHTNLRCRFLPLLTWLPAPSRPVLASLQKCASHAHLTLLQTTPTKRTRCPRRTDSKYLRTVPCTCKVLRVHGLFG